MADATGAGIGMADTDYRYQAMTDGFIGRMAGAADAYSKLASDALGVAAVQLANLATLNSQWMGSFTLQMAGMQTAATGQLAASTADSIMGFVTKGAALSNSASPPVPSYQNLGTLGPGQGLGGLGGNIINLPSKTTITTP
jgi:hypothetical protein